MKLFPLHWEKQSETKNGSRQERKKGKFLTDLHINLR